MQYIMRVMKIEARVGNTLRKRKMTVAVAESCTGGGISSRITDVSGSSDYFPMGVVAYSNKIKENILGVSKETLETSGAVSQDVAIQMAQRIKLLAGTDIGVGITGIAGPGGGSKTKPVGLVYAAVVIGRKQIVKEFLFKGSRKEVKFQATQAVLDLLRRNV